MKGKITVANVVKKHEKNVACKYFHLFVNAFSREFEKENTLVVKKVLKFNMIILKTNLKV